MKRSGWFWNPVYQKRLALGLLLFGHLFWVFLGRHLYPMWRGLSDFFVRPVETISAKYENWRVERTLKIQNLDAAQKEMDTLREELAELRLERQKNSALIAEADTAIDMLGLKKLLPIEVQTTRVIANNRNAPFGGIVIDMGKDHNVVADQGVICAEGVVGRVWAVGRHQSIVLPLDAHNASTSVMLARSRSTGVLQGVSSGMAVIRYISIQETVQIGEPVYTSGLDNVFPRGMLVGYVSDTLTEQVEMKVFVALAAHMDTLGLLFLLPSASQLEFDTKLERQRTPSGRGSR